LRLEPDEVMHDALIRDHIEGCRRGDRRAQQWVFERYYRTMFGVCARYIADADSVQDVVQEGFLKAFTNIEGYTSKGSFEGWLRRVMVNTAIDHVRRRKSWNATLSNDRDIEDIPDTDAEVEEGRDWSVEQVMAALHTLTPMYRAVFNLFVFEDLSHVEIAERLGIEVGTSKSNLAKARRNLQKALLSSTDTSPID
jgi:RNA polymerase sigma factor (sigma-70 family)